MSVILSYAAGRVRSCLRALRYRALAPVVGHGHAVLALIRPARRLSRGPCPGRPVFLARLTAAELLALAPGPLDPGLDPLGTAGTGLLGYPGQHVDDDLPERAERADERLLVAEHVAAALR